MSSLKIDVLTLFPRMLDGFLSESILGRALRKDLLNIKIYNLRDWALDKHKTVDDRPFGGGPGMLLKPEPVWNALDELKTNNSHTIYLCPDGDVLTNKMAKSLSMKSHLILVSGHYEGMDQRVRDSCIDQEISIGDYVLSNGTLPAAVLIDAVARQIKDVLGEEKSLTQDCFTDNLLSFPQYTRPEEYKGHKVPEILLSGNHKEIADWRKKLQILKTKQRRPDLV